MKHEVIQFKGKELAFSYDPNALGREIEVLDSRGIEIANVQLGEYLFSLESNGEDDDFYLEVVMYGEGQDEGFSDPIYEMPKTKEEALETILDWFEEEITNLIEGENK